MRRYKFTLILILSFVAAFFIWKYGLVNSLAAYLYEENRFLYSFLSGALYSFSFTSGIAVLLFSQMILAPGEIFKLAFIAAIGGLIADLFIFRFIKDVLLHELGPHTEKIIAKATRARWERITLGLVGAIIIISPLPEEIGLALMGVTRLSLLRTTVLIFCLDVIGLYLIMSAVAKFI